ncbi:MAG: hypothetical protein Q9195_001300 [Heterodermia aff. obscurata]
MPRLVRRRPLAERLQAYLNPLDFLLWLSEELDSSDWDQWRKDWATPIGVGLNIVFLIARANSGPSTRRADDVFADDDGYSWYSWFAAFIVHLLSLLSCLNAAYTFYRRRHYRLFETSVDAVPSTPSAHRVRVDSSPLSSSPLRFLSSMLAADAAESRAHPDATKDVWELAVWDPTPLSLRMFCMFSPGHVLVYWLFLPTATVDPRPSTTVVTTIALAALLSAQLLVLQTSFSQQTKDTSIIHREVLNEYDTKFVHPRTQPLMRDVGTQHSGSSTSRSNSPAYENPANSVETYTPAVVVNRGFRTRPNPNYIRHVDPEGHSERQALSRGVSTTIASTYQTPAHLRDLSSPIRPRTAIRQPQFRASLGPEAGNGGSLGVYTHTNSPLRKAASTNFRERSSSPVKREGSPLKRVSLPGVPNGRLFGQTGNHGEREQRRY